MGRIHASSTHTFALQRYAYTLSQFNHEQLVRLSHDPWFYSAKIHIRPLISKLQGIRIKLPRWHVEASLTRFEQGGKQSPFLCGALSKGLEMLLNPFDALNMRERV